MPKLIVISVNTWLRPTANSAGSRQNFKAQFCDCGNEQAVFIKVGLFAYKMSSLWLLKRDVCMNTVPPRQSFVTKFGRKAY
jgi:hypothetical protein